MKIEFEKEIPKKCSLCNNEAEFFYSKIIYFVFFLSVKQEFLCSRCRMLRKIRKNETEIGLLIDKIK